jgi:hypothetical protein
VHLTAKRNDALLQASRRLDWRFLLREPELGQVACIGSHNPELRAVLRVQQATKSGAASAAVNPARNGPSDKIAGGWPGLSEGAPRQNRYYALWRHTVTRADKLAWGR